MGSGGVAIADQRHVQKVVLLPNGGHRRTDVGVKIVPLEAELFRRHRRPFTATALLLLSASYAAACHRTQKYALLLHLGSAVAREE